MNLYLQKNINFFQQKKTVHRKAADDKLAKQLWDVTCRDVGIAKDVPLPEVGCVQDTV